MVLCRRGWVSGRLVGFLFFLPTWLLKYKGQPYVMDLDNVKMSHGEVKRGAKRQAAVAKAVLFRQRERIAQLLQHARSLILASKKVHNLCDFLVTSALQFRKRSLPSTYLRPPKICRRKISSETTMPRWLGSRKSWRPACWLRSKGETGRCNCS